MSKARWAKAALLALALPACATAAGTTHSQTAHSQAAGQAGQPGSWLQAQANPKAEYVEHAGSRGQAAQPYAWVGSQPVYPRDQHRLAQDGMTYAGGRAGQPGSWKPEQTNSWVLQIAQNDDATKAMQ